MAPPSGVWRPIVLLLSLLSVVNLSLSQREDLVSQDALTDSRNGVVPMETPSFDVTYTLTFNETYDESDMSLRITLTMPYRTVVTSTGCKKYVTGTSCSSQTSSFEPYVNISRAVSNLEVQATGGLSLDSVTNYTSDYRLVIEMDNLTLDSGGAPSLEVKIQTNFVLEALSQDTNPFTFGAEYLLTYNQPSGMTAGSSERAITLRRPILDVSFSASPATLSSLVTSTVVITIRHTAGSSVPANQLKVSLSLRGTSIATLTGSATLSKNSGPATNIGDLTNVFPGSETAALNDVYQIQLARTVVDLPELEATAPIDVSLEYRGQDVNSNDVVFTRNFRLAQATPSVVFSSQAGNVDLPSTLPAGGTLTLSRTVLLPRGVLNQLEFGAEFASSQLSPIPITFTQSTLTYDSQISFSDPTKINVDSDGFQTSVSRRRRSLERMRRATAGLSVTRSVGQVTNTGTNSASLTINVALSVGDPSVGGVLSTADTTLNLNGQTYYLTSSTVTVNKPILMVVKTAEYEDTSPIPDRMRFNLTVSHHPNSVGDAHDVTLSGGNTYFDVYWRENFVGPPLQDMTITSNRQFAWNQNLLSNSPGSVMVISYSADAATNQANIPAGDTWINASVSYRSGSNTPLSYTIAGCCLSTIQTEEKNLFLNHGVTVMAFIVGLIIGAVVVVIIMLIVIKVCKKVPFAYKDSEADNKTHMLAMDGGLVMNTKMAVTKGYYSSKDVSKTLEGSMSESIVGILKVQDTFQVHRELDNRDIQATILVDTQLEDERDQAMVKTTIELLKALQTNGDLSPEVVDRCLRGFKKGVADLDRNTESNFRNELGNMYDKLSAKNRDKLSDLLAQQQEEEEELHRRTKDQNPQGKDEMIKLMRKKHETEKNELTNQLRLEQEESAEKIRKEYSIRKRMNIKELQQDTLESVKKDGKLTEQQADWLMKEYLKNQAGVEKIFDDEISRQRMLLEEKLARRRALAQQTEAQEEHQTEVLNTMATQQLQAINKMKKEKVLSSEEAQALIDKTHEEMLNAKRKLDQERIQQENALQQKLSERKKKRLEENAKKHQQEKAELEKKHKAMQTDGYVDPLTILEEQQHLASIQRQELRTIENEMDAEHTDELLQLRDQLADETRRQLALSKQSVFSTLKDHGMTEDQANKLISKHKKDMEKLEETQQEEKERQQEILKKNLAKRRREWASRREEEKKEQEQLREHEEQVVRKLMDNQVAMSEEERDRIMQEHEKQMVKLENSLTLNKLQQKRMLEEKLAKRRSQQMEKLQQKQQQEVKKVTKQLDNDSDLDDDDRHAQELELMKKHAEQRIAILQGEKIDVEDEMESVREQMLKERAAALQEQEVRLGVLMASLQMEKAKEMARIEEQQKAIHDLKSNLMDHLNDKGILPDPRCQQVIEMHRREQEKLQVTLDAQRAKQEKRLQNTLQRRLGEKEQLLQQQQELECDEPSQETDKALRRRLQERLANKEANLAAMQEQQIRDAGLHLDTPAAKIRRVALKHKHLMEMEQFRNRMEKEISQTLEEVRRQNDMRRIQDSQNQELQFINGLVRLGTFRMEELENVIELLFPLKSEEEKQQMLATLTEGYKPRQEDSDSGLDETDGGRTDGTLLERVKSARYERAMSARSSGRRNSRPSRQGHASGTGKQRTKKKKGMAARLSGRRPEPVGRSTSPNYDSDDDGRRSTSGRRRLPPVVRRRRGSTYTDNHYDN